MINFLERDGEGEEGLFHKYYIKQFPNCFISAYVQDLGYFDGKPLNGLMMSKNSYSIPLNYSFVSGFVFVFFTQSAE